MSGSIPLIDCELRNCVLRYTVDSNSLFFTVVRFDGNNFFLPAVLMEKVEIELEKKFIEVIDLFQSV